MTEVPPRSVRRHFRAKAPLIALLGAVLLSGLVVAIEFEIVRQWREGDATYRWLRLVETMALAGLFGLGGAAVLACSRSDRMRTHERRLRAEAAYEARRGMSQQDPLTGLPSKRAAVSALTEAIADARGATLAFYVLDLNGFKSVNSAYGSETGDAILRVVARRFRSVARSNHFIARLESDAFAVLARDVESRREAIEIGQRYIAALDDAIRIGDRAYVVGATVGLAYYPEDGATAEELMSRADLAVRSKNAAQRSELLLLVALTNAPAA